MIIYDNTTTGLPQKFSHSLWKYLVEQVLEGHDVVVGVQRVNAVVERDEAAPDRGKKIVGVLPDLNVIASEAAQILYQHQIDPLAPDILDHGKQSAVRAYHAGSGKLKAGVPVAAGQDDVGFPSER